MDRSFAEEAHILDASYLGRIQGTLWRWDANAIIGAIALGLMMTVFNGVMERIDMALTDGSFVILGAIGFYTIAATSTLLFRLPGGIITGELNAVIALLTSSSVMAPWFIPTNAVFAVVYALVVWKTRMRSWENHFAANFLGVWTSMLVILVGQLVTLEPTLKLALTSYVVTCIAGTLGATILSTIIAKVVDRLQFLV